MDTRTVEQKNSDTIRRYNRLNKDSSVIYNTISEALIGESKLSVLFFTQLFFIVSILTVCFFFFNVFGHLETLLIVVGVCLISISSLLIWRKTFRKSISENHEKYKTSLEKNYKNFSIAMDAINKDLN